MADRSTGAARTLRTAWTLASKDLRLFFRDRTALALTLALPIVLATVFGAAMKGMMGGGGGGGALPKVKLFLEDLDGSAQSEQLLVALEGSESLDCTRGEDARRRVSGGDYAAGLVIPAGYGAALMAGELPPLQLLRDPAHYIAQQAVTFALLPVVAEASIEHLSSDLMGTALEVLSIPEEGRAQAETLMRATWDDMDALFSGLESSANSVEDGLAQELPSEEAGGGFDPLNDLPAFLGIEIEDVAGVGDDGIPRSAAGSHAISSMAVMMLMFSLVAAGGTLLEEKDGGTLQRLQLTPSAGRAVLLGKLCMLGLIGLMQLCVLFAYGWLVFDTPIFARPFALLCASLALIVATVGLGLFFSVACSTRKQVEGFSTLVILVMSALGGAWFPREVTPDWFQTAGLFTITAHAMDAFHGILWYGKGLLPTAELDGIVRELLVLFSVGGGLILWSARLYRRRFVDLP